MDVSFQKPESTGNFELKLFWEMEHFGFLDDEPNEEKFLEELLKLTKRKPGGTFTTGLQWNRMKISLTPN